MGLNIKLNFIIIAFNYLEQTDKYCVCDNVQKC